MQAQQSDLTTWFAIRDVMRTLDVSQPYAHRLVAAGRLRAVRTRLGYLVDPQSVAEFQRTRRPRRRPEIPAA